MAKAKPKWSMNTLGSWKIDPLVETKLKGISLLNIYELAKFFANTKDKQFRILQISNNLLGSILQRFDHNTHSFDVCGKKLGFYLDDVFYLTGLPVDGKAVTCDYIDRKEACEKYLGKDPGEYIKLSWLKENFEKVAEEDKTSDEALNMYCRAFLLYIIGSSIGPHCKANNVYHQYLPLLSNLKSVDKFSWGSAMLSNMYYHLSTKKESIDKGTAYLPCFVYPLMISFFLRIPKLLDPFHTIKAAIKPKEVPLMLGWADILRRTTWQSYQPEPIFMDLVDDDIVWQPYKEITLSASHIAHTRLGRSCTNLICLDRATHHYPEMAPQQFGIDALDESTLAQRKDLPDPRKGGSGTSGKPMIDDEFVTDWGKRGENLIKNRIGEETHKSGVDHEDVLNGIDQEMVIEISDDDDEDDANLILDNPESTIWYYLDPSQEVQGPFSMNLLSAWKSKDWFEPDFRVWKKGQTKEEAILLTDAISQVFPSK